MNPIVLSSKLEELISVQLSIVEYKLEECRDVVKSEMILVSYYPDRQSISYLMSRENGSKRQSPHD